ncbi:MAG: D-sedoheptulose 7-phosphate isomerase [Dehalococcoidales bacterium]|jgi:D-sedoheptulose 7-phosphate isomerase|nr:D-sedoheptulose 7-phosphate isomerase [Dehalococcoidales bacterium]MDP6737470.1 D-sedoheptulose 7-phosphate isomerase [Dehalococcoidales bacterium]|tara:strand:+ start:3605 stop:4204 length:600 start_codon:yes stop_codon:yes gene_type:complete
MEIHKAGSMHREITNRLEENAQVQRTIARDKTHEIEEMVNLILTAYRSGGKVILFGNGGSAADAQHLAGELVGKFKLERQAFPAIALTTNTSILTALSNDYGYETVFGRQVEALATEKDVIVGLSTSGNSPNVIEAIKIAKARGAKTIGLTGGNGGRLAEVADLVLVVPSDNTPQIQEMHITIGHIVCELVESELASTD